MHQELKIIKPTGVLASIWPGAQQIGRLTRTAKRSKDKDLTVEVVCIVTSLSAHQAPVPRVNEIIRGHWGIGNKLHDIRDTAFGEDANRSRVGNTPRIIARLTDQRGHHSFPTGW